MAEELTALIEVSSTSTHEVTTEGDKSAARVFDTLELLENIAMRLPMKDVLTIRIVNKFCHAAVLSSTTSKRKLFLVAKPKTDLWSADCLTEVIRRYDGRDLKICDGLTMTAVPNTALLERWGARIARTEYRMRHGERMICRKGIDLAEDDSIYLDMFLSQSPATKLTYEISVADSLGRGRGVLYGTVTNKAGVTLRDVFKHYVSNRPSSKIGTKGDSPAPVTGKFIINGGILDLKGVVFESEAEMEILSK